MIIIFKYITGGVMKDNKREKIDIENIFREYDIRFKSKNLEEKYMNLLK